MQSEPMIPGLSIVMPAFNESGSLPLFLPKLLTFCQEQVRQYEIIIVNDGSTDNTAEILREWQLNDAHIVPVDLSANQGYGGALREGLKRAQYEYTFITDSDGQIDISGLPEAFGLLTRYDFILGYREKRSDPYHRIVFGKLWNFICRRWFGLTTRDVDCAFKLFATKILGHISLESTGAVFNPEFVVKTLRAGFTVKEIPVQHFPRRSGISSGGSWKVIRRAFIELRLLSRKLQSPQPHK